MDTSYLPNLNVVDGKIYPEPKSSNEKRFWKSFVPTHILGGGTSSWVVAAKRRSDHVDVAVKILYAGKFTQINLENDMATTREAYALSKLQNVTGVNKMLCCIASPEKVLIALERPKHSMTLGDYLIQRGPCNEDQARYFTRQLVFTTALLLTRGVLHCDLRVENILIDLENFELKLIDFSSAALIRKPGETFLLTSAMRPYAPPETYKAAGFDPNAGTVWLLGIILYKILTGVVPFRSESECVEGGFTYPPLISCYCKNLLELCLESRTECRIYFDDLKYHEWFTMHPIPPWQELGFAVDVGSSVQSECTNIGASGSQETFSV